jgi:hypothetical protein
MNASADAMLAIAVRAARTAGAIVLDAGRDLKRLPAFSKEHAQVAAAAVWHAGSSVDNNHYTIDPLSGVVGLIATIEVREPGAGQVRVAVSHCGVCHSDLSIADGVFPAPLPIVLGHEAAGLVESVGPGVTGLLGHNGAGKSTLLRLIQGQIEADGGSIGMTGRTRVGAVPQDPPGGDITVQSASGRVQLTSINGSIALESLRESSDVCILLKNMRF